MPRRPTALLALALFAAPAPLAPQEAPSLRWSGEVRLRSELDDRSAGRGADHATLLRTRLGLAATVSPAARVFAQLQDARALGEGTGTVQAQALRLDMHQAWLELSDSAGGRPWSLRLGRQEIALGDERLVGAVGWTNVGRAFDGARLRSGGFELFAATVRERDLVGDAGLAPRENEGLDRDHAFGGVWMQGSRGAAWLLHDRNGTAAGRVDVDRTTPGGRLALSGGGLSLTLDASAQHGRQTIAATGARQDVRAWMVAGRGGWAAPARRLRAAGVGVDWLSGDADPADGTYGAFQTLYGTNHRFYGFMDLLLDPAAQTGGRGLVDVLGTLTVAPGPRLPLEVTLHRFLLDRTAPTGRDLGWEADLTLPFPAVSGVRGLAGYSAFRGGKAAPAAGLASGAWLQWAYVQLTAAF
jgi:hypothetical protein